MTRHTLALPHAGLAVTALAMALAGGHPAARQPPLAARIVATDPSTYRPLKAVHAGAGNMAFASLLNRGAIGPHFNFLHRGEIPAGSGIGHHFHNTAEEMFVILNGEAQFTINGRTARLEGPAAVVCRMGDSHAILNTGTETLQWMNFQASSVAGVTDAFDLGDDRVGAAVDRVPTFINARLDRALIRPGGARGRGGAATPQPPGVTSRRVFAPAVFRSAWAYVDHVLVAQGANTPDNAHESVGEAYYVLAGSGTVKIGGETAPVQRWNAIPVTVGETSAFTNTGSEPLELLVVGVARDMDAKTAVMRGAARP
ncbi:MAG TPA: cupin domain-containing protein [Vicinamibacterales bacterium]|nr:cupin domain-containing protein [Vicinamibacterales bacterium]